MGLLSKFAKAGVAKRVAEEARKPQNQRRIKDAFSKLTNRGGGKQTPGKR